MIMSLLFPNFDGNNCKNNDMEPRPIASTVRCLLFDGSFDTINSPQYLNFNGSIPEQKDSFFGKFSNRYQLNPSSISNKTLIIDSIFRPQDRGRPTKGQTQR